MSEPWLLPLALATLVLGTLGALAARGLRRMISYLVIASVGTMLTAVALGGADSVGAAIYYMVHSTIILAALFLIADLISRERGVADDRFEPAPAVAQPALLGGLFLTAGMAVAGLPPLSGFIGKVLILESAVDSPAAPWVFTVVLVTGLLTLVALSRAGSTVFWNVGAAPSAAGPVPAATMFPAVALLCLAIVLALLAGPVVDYAAATARQLVDPGDYIDAVLGDAAEGNR